MGNTLTPCDVGALSAGDAQAVNLSPLPSFATCSLAPLADQNSRLQVAFFVPALCALIAHVTSPFAFASFAGASGSGVGATSASTGSGAGTSCANASTMRARVAFGSREIRSSSVVMCSFLVRPCVYVPEGMALLPSGSKNHISRGVLHLVQGRASES